MKSQLLRRRKYGWFWLAVGVLCVLAAGSLWLVATILPGVLVATAGAGLIARGLHAITYTRRSIGEIEARDKALPAARVIE